MPRVVKFPSRLCAIALVALALPSTASAAGELTIVSSVRVEAPKGFFTGQPLRFSFTARNQTAAPVVAKALSVPVRSAADPATPIDAVCINGFNVTIPVGGTFDCVASLDAGYPAVTSYTYWADWWGADDTWHHGELGPDQAFALAAPPQTSLSAAGQVSVGEQGLGGARDTSITVTNSGGAVLLIDRGASFGGLHPGDFALVGDSCTQAPVPAGGSCTFIVRFTPSAAGVRAGTLSFKANTSTGTHVLNLSGAGVAPAVPVIVTTPERLAVTLRYDYSRLGRTSTRFTGAVGARRAEGRDRARHVREGLQPQDDDVQALRRDLAQGVRAQVGAREDADHRAGDQAGDPGRGEDADRARSQAAVDLHRLPQSRGRAGVLRTVTTCDMNAECREHISR